MPVSPEDDALVKVLDTHIETLEVMEEWASKGQYGMARDWLGKAKGELVIARHQRVCELKKMAKK